MGNVRNAWSNVAVTGTIMGVTNLSGERALRNEGSVFNMAKDRRLLEGLP